MQTWRKSFVCLDFQPFSQPGSYAAVYLLEVQISRKIKSIVVYHIECPGYTFCFVVQTTVI